MTHRRWILLGVSAAMVGACGGGGGPRVSPAGTGGVTGSGGTGALATGGVVGTGGTGAVSVVPVP